MLLALVLLRLWQRQLAAMVRDPRGTSAASEGGGHGGLGLLGRLPGTPLGAVAARSALYWRRDPRLNFPAVITSLLPAGLVLAWHFGDSELALVGMPLVCAYLLGWGQHNDVGYDSTAFWLHVASGVDGTSDRVGRLFPSMALGAVLVPGYALAGSALGGRWDLLPATLGVGLALLLSGFAVASVTSAVKQYPCPARGRAPSPPRPGARGSPSSCRPWSGRASWSWRCPRSASGPWPGSVTAGPPGRALVLGPTLGAVVMVLGVRLGARLFEQRGPELLQDLVRVR